MDVDVVNPPDSDLRVSIEPSQVRVALRDQGTRNSVDTAHVRAYIDLRGKEEGIYTVKVFTALSEPAVLEQVVPREVLVIITPR